MKELLLRERLRLLCVYKCMTIGGEERANIVVIPGIERLNDHVTSSGGKYREFGSIDTFRRSIDSIDT